MTFPSLPRQTKTAPPAIGDLAVGRRGLLAGAAIAALALTRSERRARAAAIADRALDIVGAMSFEERIAQFFFLEAQGVEMGDGYRRDLEDVRPGGILYVMPNIGSNEQVKDFSAGIHATNDRIPPFIGIDQEGGPVTRLVDDPAPGAVALGTLSDDEVLDLQEQRAKFLAGYGIDINFAPVADIAYDASSTMVDRSFGSDPAAVAEKVAATVKASRAGGVIGAAKHFPGHGRTSVDSHALVPEIDTPYETWLETDALPFKAAIQQGVEMVMLGHLRYQRIDGRPMSISRVAVNALREDLGFERLIVTDDLGMGALADYDPMDVIDLAIDAGIDILLYAKPPASWDVLIRHVEGQVRRGVISRTAVNLRARRVVELKLRHFGI